VVSTAFISPYRKDRDEVRSIVGEGDMVEIFVKCDLEICEQRDPKGLYKKARAGEIPEFTGISAPYEEPKNPELIIDSGKHSVEESANLIIEYLKNNSCIY
jgi:adenylylsulfate kinase